METFLIYHFVKSIRNKSRLLTFFFLPSCSSNMISFTMYSIQCLRSPIWCCIIYLLASPLGLYKHCKKLSAFKPNAFVSMQWKNPVFKLFWVTLCLSAFWQRLQQLWGKNVCCLVFRQFFDILWSSVKDKSISVSEPYRVPCLCQLLLSCPFETHGVSS